MESRMSDEHMSLSTCLETMEPPSKSVTKVQKLPNVAAWNDNNAVLRDYIKSFFSKRTPILRLKHEMTTRKRVIILTDTVLLVYETNCTGYSFDIRSALKLKTECTGCSGDAQEKACVVTLKYKFGSVNLVLVNTQISVWRRTLSTIFEGEYFDRSLMTDLSLYTAKDSDLENSFLCNIAESQFSESVITSKSARGCIDRCQPDEELTLDETQNRYLDPEKTNSNRSLTYLPATIRSSVSRPSLVSIESNRQPSACQNSISIRQGTRCVSYLAKKFEQKLGSLGKKSGGKVREDLPQASSPLECLFPPLPIKKLQEVDLKSNREKKPRHVSKLDITPLKRGKQLGEEIVIYD